MLDWPLSCSDDEEVSAAGITGILISSCQRPVATNKHKTTNVHEL